MDSFQPLHAGAVGGHPRHRSARRRRAGEHRGRRPISGAVESPSDTRTGCAAALRRDGGMAEWKPRWHLLWSPRTPSWEVRAPYSTSPAPTERRECYVIGTTNPAHLVPSVPSPTNVLHLRITARYTKGRPRPDGKPRPIPCPHRAHNLPTVTHMSSGLVWSPDAGRSPVDTLTCTSEMSSSLTEGTRNPRIQAICVPSAGKR